MTSSMPTPDDGALLNLELPGRAEAASAARRALAALNGDLHLISETRLRDAQLLLTELVSNAVRHTGTDSVTFRVRATPRRLRVDVAHAGPRAELEPRRDQPLDEGGGWGLRIVDVVADAWGVDGDDEHMSVWFEIDRPQSDEPLSLSGDASPPADLEEPAPE